ncbi:MAG TPA: PIN domain-containing protein [Terriglobia bacterium]|nr:PIN domain-containing protein [Terriglobia bacterium]
MKPLFADTFYFLALLHVDDEAHSRAVGFSETSSEPLLTTAWVLTEVADALAMPGMRETFTRLLTALRGDPAYMIVPPTQTLFDQGVELYAERPDKDWSLTDCISFVVMRDQGITQALTGDHHFEQAGFMALLK